MRWDVAHPTGDMFLWLIGIPYAFIYTQTVGRRMVAAALADFLVARSTKLCFGTKRFARKTMDYVVCGGGVDATREHRIATAFGFLTSMGFFSSSSRCCLLFGVR